MFGLSEPQLSEDGMFYYTSDWSLFHEVDSTGNISIEIEEFADGCISVPITLLANIVDAWKRKHGLCTREGKA